MKTQLESSGKFDFVGKIGIFGGISVILVLISMIYIVGKGINYGIDFRGGTEMQVKFAQSVTIDQVRGTVVQLGLGDVSV